VFLVGIVLGWTLHSKTKIKSFSSLQDFRYMHIPNLVPKLKGSISPDLVFVSDRIIRKKLRIDTVYVPKKMQDYVLSNPDKAITTSGSTIRWNAWNPKTRQYQVRQYHFHPSPWHYNIAANASNLSFNSIIMTDMMGNIGYGPVKIGIGPVAVTNLLPKPHITVGPAVKLHIKLIGKE